jgi:bifunctional NMN adenylyltransferase/nudix hydrolase
MKKGTAVLIGRFQPFHNGHKYLVDYAVNNYKKIIIIIGSSNKFRTRKNPFTYEERKEMIVSLYGGDGSKILVLPLRDYPNDDITWERLAISLIKKNTDDEVTIIGYKKNNECYLEMFPNLSKNFLPGCFYNPEQGDVLNATFIRNEFFKFGCVNYALVPTKVMLFLFKFTKTTDYQKIKEEYHG